MKVELRPWSVRLREPLLAAHGPVTERELLELRLTDSGAVTGRGEAAPLPSYHGVDRAQAIEGIEACRSLLESSQCATDEPAAAHDDLLARCAELTDVPQALAAIDVALWDLIGRRARVPVWRLLGACDPPAVEVNATLTAADRSSAAAQAAAARAAGFGTVKLKVAIGDDAGRVAAVRAAAGPQMKIRIDANGGWTIVEAAAALRALAPARIELCEEPVSGVLANQELRDQGLPVATALDESATAPGAFETEAADAVCLKLAACGGISGMLRAAARARRAGYDVYLASTLDGPLGIAAALHAAAAIGPDRACGLATLALLQCKDPFPPERGRIAVPRGPGLGV